MKSPRMPGFTAELSVYRSRTHYRTTGQTGCVGTDVPDGTGHVRVHPVGGPAEGGSFRLARQRELLPRRLSLSSSVVTNRLAARDPRARKSQPPTAVSNRLPPPALTRYDPPPASSNRVPIWKLSSIYPFAVCDGTWVDLMSDRTHCGTCSNSCAGDGTVDFPDDDLCFCHTGGCACWAHCPQVSGFEEVGGVVYLRYWTSCGTDCVGPGQCKTWRCRDLNSDPNNCGACGVLCLSPLTCCSGNCIDLTSDIMNCGSCGNACPAMPNSTTKCTNGDCTYVCNPGFTNCSGACVDITSDRHNCSGCGKACPGNKVCVGSMCICAVDKKDCGGGMCVNVMGTDPNNCGDCGKPCPSPRKCCGGGQCADITSDPLNCGDCSSASHPPCAQDCIGTRGSCINGVCESLGSFYCYRVDVNGCLTTSQTYKAFDPSGAQKCSAHDQTSADANSYCGPMPQTFTVNVYQAVDKDPDLCPTGRQCYASYQIKAHSSSDAVACASSKYNTAPGLTFVAELSQCIGGICT